MKRYNDNYGKKADSEGKRIIVAPAMVGGKRNPTYEDFIANGYYLLKRTEPEEIEGYVPEFNCWENQIIDGKLYLVMTWNYIEIPVDSTDSTLSGFSTDSTLVD